MSELIKRIIADIEETGFPLELRVARLLNSRDYFVATNVYFVDKDEEKGREIDMRALKNVFFPDKSKDAAVRHCLLIECKKSASHPWVFCMSPTASYDPNFEDVLSNGVGHRRVDNFRERTEFGERHPWFTERDRGRSFFEAFTKGSDRSIQQGILASIKASIEAWESEFAGRYYGMHNAIFYYPIVVLDGELFVARMESSGLVVGPADQVSVSVDYRSPRYQRNYDPAAFEKRMTFLGRHTVLVVRESFLPKAIEALDSWLVACRERFEKDKRLFAVPPRKATGSSSRTVKPGIGSTRKSGNAKAR
jgi:hypothetical protein